MNCKYCGAITYPTDHFCSVCGKLINPVTENTNTQNTTQVVNTRANVNTFDSYNYNRNRYNSTINNNEVVKSNQIAFANSIAISLLIVMIIVFIIIAFVYYSKVGTIQEASANTTSSSPTVYTPTYQNTTTSNTTSKPTNTTRSTNSTNPSTTTKPTNSTSSRTSHTKTASVYSRDNLYEVDYEVPSSLTSYNASSDYLNYYLKNSTSSIIEVAIYECAPEEMFVDSDFCTISESIKTYGAHDYIYINGYFTDYSQKEYYDYYLLEFEPDYTLSFSICPLGLTDSELKTLLDVDIIEL